MLCLAGLVMCLFAALASGAVRGKEAKYIGGTIPGLEEKTEGVFEFSGENAAVFVTKKGKRAAIPYQGVESLEFGQKAGRRVGVAVAVTPLALFSKKRKHYLSIRYVDEEGKSQGAVFELAKGIVRSTLSTFETRSGKAVEYESEEAKRHAGN
jgi:hypothetical protein